MEAWPAAQLYLREAPLQVHHGFLEGDRLAAGGTVDGQVITLNLRTLQRKDNLPINAHLTSETGACVHMQSIVYVKRTIKASYHSTANCLTLMSSKAIQVQLHVPIV